MKIRVFGFETIGSSTATPFSRAPKTDLDWDIENDGQVRQQIADRDALHRLDQLEIGGTKLALIDACGIDEAIAQHPGAACERRVDQTSHMIVARSRKQQRFRIGPQQLADASKYTI